MRRAQTRCLRKQLQSQKEEAQSQWDVLNERFEQTLRRGRTDAAQRTILRQYYAMGMTDSKIAGLLGCTTKNVCNRRLSWVRRVEEFEA